MHNFLNSTSIAANSAPQLLHTNFNVYLDYKSAYAHEVGVLVVLLESHETEFYSIDDTGVETPSNEFEFVTRQVLIVLEFFSYLRI